MVWSQVKICLNIEVHEIQPKGRAKQRRFEMIDGDLRASRLQLAKPVVEKSNEFDLGELTPLLNGTKAKEEEENE